MSPTAATTADATEVARASAGIPAARPHAQVRLASIDAYRSLVMLLMMAEVLRFKAASHNSMLCGMKSMISKVLPLTASLALVAPAPTKDVIM
jgi:hypothetical protein